MRRPFRIHWLDKSSGKRGILKRRHFASLESANKAKEEIADQHIRFPGNYYPGDYFFWVEEDRLTRFREYVDLEFAMYESSGHYKQIESAVDAAQKFLTLYRDKVNVVMPRSILIGLLWDILNGDEGKQ